MNAREKGWLEAFIDAEGTISFNKNKNKYRQACRGFQWHPKLRSTNTELKLLQRFQDIIGGGRIYGPYGPRGDNRRKNFKPQWEYQLSSSKKIVEVLTRLSLVSKEKQRLLLIEACTLLQQQKPRFTPHDARLEEIHTEMRKLNRRGVK